MLSPVKFKLPATPLMLPGKILELPDSREHNKFSRDGFIFPREQ
jgi:hypothetical protein